MAKKIDTHAHLGECCVFGLYATEEDMIRRMDESGVDATIVQPYPGAKDYVKKHDEIERLCVAHHGKSSGGGHGHDLHHGLTLQENSSIRWSPSNE
jgi:hypothetical protein